MGEPERTRIRAQRGETSEELGIGRTREQAGEQPVLGGTRGIDLVDRIACARAVQVGPQHDPADARHFLHRQYTLGGHTRPVRDGGLRNAYFAGKLAHASNCTYGFVEPRIAHP
jgi:hypothetical protein